MWANINPPKGYNKPHVHPNTLYLVEYIMLKAPFRLWAFI